MTKIGKFLCLPQTGKLGRHLLLYLAGFVAGNLSEVIVVGSIDDAARRVNEQTAIFGHAITAHLFETSTLSTHARHKQEMIGSHATNIAERGAK